MKKLLIFNIVIVLLIWLSEPFYIAVYNNSPGAKLALNVAMPFICSYILCSIISSIIYSVYQFIKTRNKMMLIPIVFLIAGIVPYYLIQA